jgi:hypothetical protein
MNIKKASKSLSDMLKALERTGTVAVRYWRFRTGAATAIQLNEIVDILVKMLKDATVQKPKEILYHPALLAFFQVDCEQSFAYLCVVFLMSFFKSSCLAYKRSLFVDNRHLQSLDLASLMQPATCHVD